MASRLGLGRIIEWAKNADLEELHYVTHRISTILQKRADQVNQADANVQRKRRGTRTQGRDKREEVLPLTREQPIEQAHGAGKSAGASFE